MIGLKIVIQEKQQSPPEDFLLEWAEAEDCELKATAILEGYTGNGRTGVALYFVAPDGKRYVARTTARIIVNGLAPAIRGFMERVGDDPNQ